MRGLKSSKLGRGSWDLVRSAREPHSWSGQVLDTIDYAGFIGRDPGGENIYVAMGNSGQGLTHGVAGAMLNTALIMGENHPWQELYSPGRIPLRAAKNFVMENITTVKSFAEYVAPGELPSLDEIARGQGAIVRRGGEKVAAYRDHKGALHLTCRLPSPLEQLRDVLGLSVPRFDVRHPWIADQRSGDGAAGQDQAISIGPWRRSEGRPRTKIKDAFGARRRLCSRSRSGSSGAI